MFILIFFKTESSAITLHIFFWISYIFAQFRIIWHTFETFGRFRSTYLNIFLNTFNLTGICHHFANFLSLNDMM